MITASGPCPPHAFITEAGRLASLCQLGQLNSLGSQSCYVLVHVQVEASPSRFSFADFLRRSDLEGTQTSKMGACNLMAFPYQQPTQKPATTGRSPHHTLANASRNHSGCSPHPSASLHGAAKRRKLNHTISGDGSKTSASRWFDTVNQNVRPSIQSISDADREHIEPSIRIN
jgi:hypothetical protein